MIAVFKSIRFCVYVVHIAFLRPQKYPFTEGVFKILRPKITFSTIKSIFRARFQKSPMKERRNVNARRKGIRIFYGAVWTEHQCKHEISRHLTQFFQREYLSINGIRTLLGVFMAYLFENQDRFNFASLKRAETCKYDEPMWTGPKWWH